jgi:hypothetical protein
MTNLKTKIIKDFEEKFPVRPALDDKDRLVIYSREEFGLIEANVEDIKSFLSDALNQVEKEVREEMLTRFETWVNNHPDVHLSTTPEGALSTPHSWWVQNCLGDMFGWDERIHSRILSILKQKGEK